jgi:hypothetical protein
MLHRPSRAGTLRPTASDQLGEAIASCPTCGGVHHDLLGSGADGCGIGWLASIETTINNWFEPIAYWSTTIIFYPIPFFGTEAPIVTFWWWRRR